MEQYGTAFAFQNSVTLAGIMGKKGCVLASYSFQCKELHGASPARAFEMGYHGMKCATSSLMPEVWCIQFTWSLAKSGSRRMSSWGCQKYAYRDINTNQRASVPAPTAPVMVEEIVNRVDAKPAGRVQTIGLVDGHRRVPSIMLDTEILIASKLKFIEVCPSYRPHFTDAFLLAPNAGEPVPRKITSEPNIPLVEPASLIYLTATDHIGKTSDAEIRELRSVNGANQ
jgi:hypothetical protein